MIRRLPGFAARLHLSPVEVWALPVDEWVVLAVALDRAVEDERRAADEMRRRHG